MCRIIRNISILLLLICISRISCEDDLPDFDFVDSPIEPQAEESGRLDYIYYDKNYDELEHYFVDDEFNVHINRTKGLDLDDTDFPENDGLNFKEKEQKLRKVIIKALSVGELRRKFSEVMPMLRAMSKSQRITLAALITAQINAKNGNTLTLDQVILICCFFVILIGSINGYHYFEDNSFAFKIIKDSVNLNLN